jgi:arylsulfatase A-like enzyme
MIPREERRDRVLPSNVLWIYCDELRADALGCYASPAGFRPHTPHIDALAAGGVVFDRCYANSPVCVPSRTATLTGRLPEETGVYHNEAAAPGFPIPRGLQTFPEVFAAAGYATASFGKEHIPKALRPWQLDDPTGGGMGDPLIHASEESRVRTTGLGVLVAGTHPDSEDYLPDAVGHRVRDWMRTASGPFLLRASLLQPHAPVVPPERFVRMVDHDSLPDARTVPTANSRFEQRFAEINAGLEMSDEQLRRAQVAYHALVSWVDEQVGQILQELESTGLAHDTIVILTSDHGANVGEGGAFGKQTFAPRSHRVPMIIRWPRRLRPERRTDLMQSMDLPRTLAGLTGVPMPPAFGGRDVFADAEPERVFATIGYGGPRSRTFPNHGAGTWDGERGWPRRSCVRTPRFRLDVNVRLDGARPAPEDEDVFLADSLTDPDEVVNLAGDPSLAGVRDELLAAVRRHAATALEVPDASVDRLVREAAALKRAASTGRRIPE